MKKQGKYALVVLAVTLLAVVSAQATSHVRIVRMSYTSGQVQMERGPGQGLERAILNSPIVEGSRVVTGTDGLAEIEFENNSSVRLGEASEVKFRQLLINDAGDKVNEVELVRGTMYFDTRSGKDEIYRAIAAGQTFVLRQNSQMRFMMSGDQVQASVFNGEAQFDDHSQLVRLKKNDTVTVDANNPAAFVLAKGFDKLPLDAWNSEREAYQSAYAYNNNGYGNKAVSGSGYSDLAYYGAFATVPGYGLVWQPYGASSWMGWDPYMSGAWAFTPGFGYVWASAYPWGWLPYHYGSWGYLANVGWFWYPGSSLNGGGVVSSWQGNTPVVNAPAGYKPPVPPSTPTNGNRATMLVGTIGRMPAYLPGGPVPPNFRSVIIDHSGIQGMTAPSGSGTTSASAGSARAANSRSMRSGNPGSTFASPQTRGFGSATAHNNSAGGHVFVTPEPAASSAGWGWGNGNFGTAGSHGFGHGAGTSSGAGTGRASGTAAAHGGSTPAPK